ncbi:ankyrin repeat domain-containing protein [Methylomonas sp. CM2]|uniref:ankyrin repeat domain-containing protein n=1 Tax=Methylomonas sp. CM2 TaxID=3417647 RepID=UPI003CED2276
MYRIVLLSFFLLPGCQTNVRPGSACQSIIEIADAGKIQSAVLQDDLSLRESFPAILKTSLYAVKADLNGDGFEEIFGAIPINSASGLITGTNSDYGFALINPNQGKVDEIKTSIAQDLINPITYDHYDKRVIEVAGKPFILVLNATRSRKTYITQDNSPRAIWRVTRDFQLAVECEIAQFKDENGKEHHRVLKDDERILREAKEMRTPDSNPWYLISRLPGLTAFEAVLAAGWDINSSGNSRTTPLWVAIYEKRLDLVKALLLAGALPNVYPEEPEKGFEYRSVTPIEYAITSSEDSYDLAKVLIETVGSKNVKAQNGDSALSEAILYERPDIIELLFNNGAEVDDQSVHHWLETAENDSAEKVLQLLLAHGLDLNKSYSFKFPVSGIKRINENTLSVGPNITFAEKQLTPLEFARYMGNKPAEKLLIQSGAR